MSERVQPAPVILWFRSDLRLADNPALCAALAQAAPLVALFILDDADRDDRRLGGAARWWLHQSLERLGDAIATRGGRLILRRGSARTIVPELAEQIGAEAVFWNRCYEPFAIDRDAAIKTALKQSGRRAESFNGALLFEPWDIKTNSGGPYRVFTPFWRACRAAGLPQDVVSAPDPLPPCPEELASDTLTDWALEPRKPDWAGGLRDTWTPGEAGANARLETFLSERLSGYPKGRDFPGRSATSGLSPHLRFGEISPRRVVAHAQAAAEDAGSETAAEKFLSEIGWREFSYSLLYYNADLPEQNLQKKFDAFPWREDAEDLKAWRRGRTGYPIVDAAMAELWRTGWMHNRARMIVGSFLVKHLLLHWRHGEAWFWDTLVDADLANNAAGWQWIAGCGADAAPYFRVFNPITQGEKFDPEGDYVRRWVPELAKLPKKWIHKPWEADHDTLARAGVVLGRDYPSPVIAHKEGRDRALRAFESLKDAA
ncbi:MAG: cryptochrome/photolyase family protein [Maricaulaceae bacterium]